MHVMDQDSGDSFALTAHMNRMVVGPHQGEISDGDIGRVDADQLVGLVVAVEDDRLTIA